MRWLALAASFACAVALAPAALRALRRAGVVRRNYRGAELPTAFGVVVVAAALITLGPLAALSELGHADTLSPDLGGVLTYALGVALLGLVDDLLGGRLSAGSEPRADAPRGWRGHGGALARGMFSTGALKALGALGLALFVLSGRGLDAGEYIVSVGVLTLSTNLLNLLDLRPGRALKSLVLIGAGLTIGAWDAGPLQTVGLVLGAALAIAPYDLRERAMLGDAGSNLLGALAGFWLVLTLSLTGQAIALAALVGITAYGELRSISALVDRSPLLRRLDWLGRKA
jgi:UDP-N-acetylmuramyl pentapeptide phosphotransferase/UDP-N-acetylglucosamine-1-phosphate transferase